MKIGRIETMRWSFLVIPPFFITFFVPDPKVAIMFNSSGCGRISCLFDQLSELRMASLRSRLGYDSRYQEAIGLC